jgi:serine/threonine-protein kinase RsbW
MTTSTVQDSLEVCCFSKTGTGDAWQRACVVYACEVTPFLEGVVERLTALGYLDKDIFATRLVLEEAIVNGLRHGNRSDSGKRVLIRYQLRPDRILAEVEDEGPGFDPEAVPDPVVQANLNRPSGRGLLLMRHYATWIRYNRQGNCVSVCKVRSGYPDV